MKLTRREFNAYKAALEHASIADIQRYLCDSIDRFELIASVLQTYHDHVESIGTIMESMPKTRFDRDCMKRYERTADRR